MKCTSDNGLAELAAAPLQKRIRMRRRKEMPTASSVLGTSRLHKERADGHIAESNLFSIAFMCDCVDLVALGTGILGMAHRHFDLGADLGAAAAGLMVLADRYSLAMAACSFIAGVSGELLTVMREEKERFMTQQLLPELQLTRTQASSPAQDVKQADCGPSRIMAKE